MSIEGASATTRFEPTARYSRFDQGKEGRSAFRSRRLSRTWENVPRISKNCISPWGRNHLAGVRVAGNAQCFPFDAPIRFRREYCSFWWREPFKEANGSQDQRPRCSKRDPRYHLKRHQGRKAPFPTRAKPGRPGGAKPKGLRESAGLPKGRHDQYKAIPIDFNWRGLLRMGFRQPGLFGFGCPLR